MTCPPRAADTDRTVLEAIPVDESNGWWTGIVRDRDPETDEIRLRLERWVNNNGNYDNPHTWRVRPDFWQEERATVATVEQRGGRSPPASLPIHNRLTPLEYSLIRKDDVRWVAAVRVDRPHKGECLRLYHWDPANTSMRQKWTIGRHWSQVADLATQHLQVA